MIPHWTFDPDGALDSLVVDRVDGFAIPEVPAAEMPAPDPYAEVDPAIPADAVPAEPAEPGGPTALDSAWWAEASAALESARLARAEGWRRALAEMGRRSRAASELAPLPDYPDLPVAI